MQNTSGLIRGMGMHVFEESENITKVTKSIIACRFQNNSTLPSEHKFRNLALEERTAALQAEFAALMGQKQSSFA
jgi:hypothetical protein